MIGQKFLPSRLTPFCRSLDLFLGAKTSLWLPGQHCPKLVECGSHRARGRSSVNVPRCGIKAPRQAEVFPELEGFLGRCEAEFFLKHFSHALFHLSLQPPCIFSIHFLWQDPAHFSKGKELILKLSRRPHPPTHTPHEVQILQTAGSLNLK